MASNLPPGVTDSMIPGNRQEDREHAFIWQEIEAIVGPLLSESVMEQLVELVQRRAHAASAEGYRDGFQMAMHDVVDNQ